MTQAELTGAILSRRFRLLRPLGEGGMGVVYAAQPLEPMAWDTGERPSGAGSREVAIKLLKPEFGADAEVLARFLEEGRMCQRLMHPNILRVFETAQAEDGTPYLVMELLEGVPLSAYTENGGRVPLAPSLTILVGMLTGLAAAHAHGIVHRDLKPENVFLARSPNGHFQVKLLDFGIAKVMDLAGGMGARTRTGVLLGTPAYMSPEQVRSSKDVDARTDIWSAGVMGYEMLSGRVAFPAPTEYARLSAVMLNTPEPLETIDPRLAPVAKLVARAMNKDREQRFGSALEMARALVALQAGTSTGNHAASEGQASSLPAARSSLPVGGAAALSRLPEPPVLFASPRHSSSPTSDVPRMPSDPPIEVRVAEAPGVVQPQGPTLASAPTRLDMRSEHPQAASPPPRIVVLASSQGSTMPSEDLPMLARSEGPPSGEGHRGVAPLGVVLLVLVGVLAGFLLGLAVGINH